MKATQCAASESNAVGMREDCSSGLWSLLPLLLHTAASVEFAFIQRVELRIDCAE